MGGVDGWPAVTYEEWDWAPAAYAPRSLRDLTRRTYSAAVLPPIAAAPVALDGPTRTLAGEATAEIVRFDQDVAGALAPFEALLLRSESVASSRIEHLTASAKAILMAEAGDTSRRNATAIAGNVAAMRKAIDDATTPSAETVLNVHATLLGKTDPHIAGRWRDEQVWIGGRSSSPHGADFVPPHHTRVKADIADLMEFLDRSDILPFEQVLIAHAHFESIHPFPDGNGRTGRALLHAWLRTTELITAATVPISAGLLTDTDAYFAALTAYRQGDLNRIVQVGAEATFRAVANGRWLAEEVQAAQQRWRASLRDVRADALAHRLIETLPHHPLIDGPWVEATFEVSRPVANNAIKTLSQRDILTRANAGTRFRKWVAVDITAALDSFAERSGRRSLA